MAHFAQINEDNFVTTIIVVNNEVLKDENGIEQENIGIDFCRSLYGEDTNWVQTSYNNSFRFRHAGVGYIYDSTRDAFILPKPSEGSWVLNEETLLWDEVIPN